MGSSLGRPGNDGPFSGGTSSGGTVSTNPTRPDRAGRQPTLLVPSATAEADVQHGYGRRLYGQGPYGEDVGLVDYLQLVTSEHNQRPKFLAFLSALLQPFVDLQNSILDYIELFDLDEAVGQQLDFIGEWVGISRFIATPFTGVFFSFDTVGLGFDQGTWYGPGEVTTELTTLPDDAYSTLIRGKIAADHWDGTIPSMYAIYNFVFNLNEPPNIPLLTGVGYGSFLVPPQRPPVINALALSIQKLTGVAAGDIAGSGGTIPNGPLYLKVSVFTVDGQVAVSTELGPVNSGSGRIAYVTMPSYNGAVKWRVYYGTASGLELVYLEWTEDYVANSPYGGRAVHIDTIGQPGSPTRLVQIVDNQDMTMEIILLGPAPDAVTAALFQNGYLGLKPAGVSITYSIQS